MMLSINRMPTLQVRPALLALGIAGGCCGLSPAQTSSTALPPTVILPEQVAVWDQAARAQAKPADGFRIQVYLGELQAARQLRADLRKQQSLPVYVMDLAPNYRVCLGDFRDRWSADEERRRWLATYPTATVIPCPIAPPPLPTEDVHGN